MEINEKEINGRMNIKSMITTTIPKPQKQMFTWRNGVFLNGAVHLVLVGGKKSKTKQHSFDFCMNNLHWLM